MGDGSSAHGIVVVLGLLTQRSIDEQSHLPGDESPPGRLGIGPAHGAHRHPQPVGQVPARGHLPDTPLGPVRAGPGQAVGQQAAVAAHTDSGQGHRAVGGEELHNNHHAYRQSARLSNKWWEIDLGWAYIRLLEMTGLARVNRTAPKTDFVPTKPAVDVDTVKALLRNRFHVLKLYGSQVIRPVLKM